jgi:Uma2 family endonuclease
MTTEPAIEQPPAQPGPAEVPQLELSAEYLAEFQARVDQLVTEDDTPVDTIFSEKQMRLLTEPLYSSWQGPGAQRSFVVLANVGVFPSINEPPVVPDVLLSLDVRLRAPLTEKRNCTYLLWEIGKAPDVVIEIVSNRVGGEFSDKLASFARMRVTYYVVFDPALFLRRKPLHLYALRRHAYVERANLWLPEIGLGLCIWPGTYEGCEAEWLRWCYEDGMPVPTGAERAEQERTRAEQAHARAERLAAQLRALGLEPEE